ncbi:MAG TPA: HAMP domain-containing protein, partial [Tepidisphaeraceae bacterium]|nr:HAMP domain-containing protein [Tepidisphaeraceae bacterium]
MGRTTPISLRRRFLLHNLLLVGGLIVAGAISVWRLGVLRSQIEVSPTIFAELRTIGSVGTETGIVRGLLSDPAANRDAIVTRLTYAIGGLEQFIQVGQGYGQKRDPLTLRAYVPINGYAASARDQLKGVLEAITGGKPLPNADVQRNAVDAAMDDIDHASSSCIAFMTARQQTASSQLATNLFLIGILSLAAVLAALVLSIVHDRIVVAPLQRLRQGVRAVAGAQFSQKLDLSEMKSSPEFLELAGEFNRMAEEL